MSKQPLSEEIRAFPNLHEWVPVSRRFLRRWADRAAVLEREVEELRALREALADWWDPIGDGRDGWTAEHARARLSHLQRNIDAMREVIEEAGSDE